MLMYRKDLFDKAGIKMPERADLGLRGRCGARSSPTSAGVYGICLRGKPGWGDNMAFLTTMANRFGAQWFDMKWKPQLDKPEWKDADRPTSIC